MVTRPTSSHIIKEIVTIVVFMDTKCQIEKGRSRAPNGYRQTEEEKKV